MHEEIPTIARLMTPRDTILFSFLDMPRARRKKVTIRASRAKHCARTRAKRSSDEKDVKLTEMGGAESFSSRRPPVAPLVQHQQQQPSEPSDVVSVCPQEDNPPSQENPTSLQTTVMDSFSLPLPLPLPKEPDYSRMCPKCSSYLQPAVVPEGFTTSLVQCPRCSTTSLCEKCLYPCPDGTCTNQSCQVISLLLTCDRVTQPTSSVYGCPLFRACPKCNNIIMHQKGCKYVTCTQCMNPYCFICLRTRQKCAKDKNKYWSLTCSAPTAARQRFQT